MVAILKPCVVHQSYFSILCIKGSGHWHSFVIIITDSENV